MADNSNKPRITLLTGFLGTGKTTMLKRLLREHSTSVKFGVIVNDLSELEVDGELIRLGHAVSEEKGTLISLFTGSIADRKRLAFSEALQQMQQVAHIVVEASGGSHPAGIIEELLQADAAVLGAVVALVDARALLHDYSGGPALLQQLAHNDHTGTHTVENLLSSQIRVASIIVLTKVDTIANDELELMLRTIQTLNSSAKLITSAYGKLDASLLLDARPYQAPEQPHYLSDDEAMTTEAFDIGTDVLHDPRPFHPQRLYHHYRNNLAPGIFRSKGFMWLASRPDHVLLWNQAGGMLALELLGTWRAAVLNDTSLLKEERENLRTLLANQHPLFGDRANEITVIGHARDRAIFMQGLRQCLCTEEEIARWQKGYEFEDPWPKTIRQLT